LASLGDSKFDVIVSLADNSSRHTQSVLSDAWKVLKPSGSLKLAEDFNRTFDHSSALSSALTLSGFTQQQNTELDGIVFVCALQSLLKHRKLSGSGEVIFYCFLFRIELTPAFYFLGY
jgi:hypothetical protein